MEDEFITSAFCLHKNGLNDPASNASLNANCFKLQLRISCLRKKEDRCLFKMFRLKSNFTIRIVWWMKKRIGEYNHSTITRLLQPQGITVAYRPSEPMRRLMSKLKEQTKSEGISCMESRASELWQMDYR